MTMILASNSAARRAMLDAAGVPHLAIGASVDEESVKAALVTKGRDARAIADALAEMKAIKVSARHPGNLVIGCDQTLALDDGTMLDKPGTAVADQLRILSDRTHRLFSAVVAAQGGLPIWRHIAWAKLTMRPLSESFIADYVDREGQHVAECVGAYRIEGPGIQLFSAIEGDHFTILGLPLLPLLDWLRARGELLT